MLLDRVLVKPVDRVEQNRGGIIVLTNTAGDGAYIAEVVAVGPGLPYTDVLSGDVSGYPVQPVQPVQPAKPRSNFVSMPIPLQVKVGDHVALAVGALQEKAGVPVVIDGVSYRVIKESDVLVVL